MQEVLSEGSPALAEPGHRRISARGKNRTGLFHCGTAFVPAGNALNRAARCRRRGRDKTRDG